MNRELQRRYGMLNHVVYDVFVKGQKDVTTEEGLSGTSRFKQDLDSFSAEGLRFRYTQSAGSVEGVDSSRGCFEFLVFSWGGVDDGIPREILALESDPNPLRI